MTDMDRPEPVLRVAGPPDADRITVLMKESAAGLFPAYYDERQTRSGIDHIAHVDPELLADGTYFAIEVAGEMVACGGWSRRDKLYTGSGGAAGGSRILDPRTEPARVRAMFVRPDWTRRGLGRRILEECVRAARREGYERLALMATLAGVPLYEAFGFQPAGPLEDILLEDGTRMACLPMAMPIPREAGTGVNEAVRSALTVRT